MLQAYHKSIDQEKYAEDFMSRNMFIYFIFFPCAFVCIVGFSFSDKQWIPTGEFFYVAVFFAVFTLLTLCTNRRMYQFAAASLRSASLLPAVVASFPRIPVLFTLLQLLFGSPLSFEIAPDTWLSFGFPTFAHLILPIVYLSLAADNKWKGFKTCLLPQFVTAIWLEIIVLFFKTSTFGTLLTGFVSCILLVVFLPVFGVGMIIWLLFCLLEMVSMTGLFHLLIALTAIALPTGLAIWAKSGFHIAGTDINSNSGKILLVALSAFSVLPMVYFITPPEPSVGDNYLSWDKYRNYCSEPQWEKTGIARAQTICAHFQGTVVNWEGIVQKVVVKDISNQVDGFVSHLPSAVSDLVRCGFGSSYPECNELEDEIEKELCELRTMQGRKCHLRGMDQYTFEIWISMPISESKTHTIRITAHHRFRNVVSNLKKGNVVNFHATLEKELGNTWPQLKLHFLHCKDCLISLVPSTAIEDEDLLTTVLRLLRSAVFNVFNVFTAPFVQFGQH